MKSPFKLLAVLVTAFGLAAAACAAEVSPAGTWKWTVQGRQGGQGFEQTLKLDYKDGKLSGTMLGRQGGQFPVPDAPITDASLTDGVIKFTVSREFNDRKFVSKYEGKLDGDSIKGASESTGFGDGPIKREWAASRQK